MPAAFELEAEGSDASDTEPVQQAAPSTSGRRPAWDDPDDLSVQVNIATQPRLKKLRKTEQDGIVSGVHCTLLSVVQPRSMCMQLLLCCSCP